MKNKNKIYEKEFNEFSGHISNKRWYSANIEDVLADMYDISVQWDDTLEFMDTLIRLFEKHKMTDELIIIQARFALPDAQQLDPFLPQIEEAKNQSNHPGSICAFPFKIATILNRLEFFQKPIWNHSPKYHSMKLFTYYRCTRMPDDQGHPDNQEDRYIREIVRFYSQKWTQGNSPGFLLP